MSRTKYDVIPGNLQVTIVKDDGFSMLMTANVDLSSYTFDGGVYNSAWTEIVPFTITNVDLVHGKVNISLTPAQTQYIGVGTWNWGFTWIDGSGIRRTVAGGIFSIVNG